MMHSPSFGRHPPSFEFGEELALLIDAVKDYAIFMLDPAGHVATWNAGAEAIKGYRPEEIIGKHFSIFYSEADIREGKPERKLQIARAEGKVEDEGWRLRKDGTRFWANVIITAIHDEQGTLRGFAKVTRDVTERKNTEEVQRALIEQKEARLVAESERRSAEAAFHAAREANRAKDEFLMTLSHELRTPMTAILGWSRLLPTLPANDPIVPEALASIARSADLQAQLIDDVLDVSGIVSGKLRLNIVEVDVARVLAAAVEAVRHGAAAKDIGLVTDLAGNLGSMLTDPTRLQQIVWNLLTNAVKFTPAGGRVELRATRAGEQLQIVVSDSGQGIEASFLPRVFEPFLQGEKPQTRVHGGLGLGLSIVRYLTEAQGGTVTVASEGTGRGATFTIRLPLREGGVPERVEVPGVPTAMPAAPWTGRLSGLAILLVDDDDDSRSLVATTFRRAGASVRAVGSAQAALLSVEEERPDAVITDIAMPNADGYSLLAALRMRPELRGVPVVALSAFAADATFGEAGFSAFLNKPIDPFRLLDEVASVMGR